MLPGVEVARRRRFRPAQGRYGVYDGGVRCSDTHRSRFLANGAHHQHQSGSYPRLQPLFRVQENLQEHQQCSQTEQAKATLDIPNKSNSKENFTIDNDQKQQRWVEETRRPKFFSSLWKRQPSCSHSDPGDLAKDARNRLDELLQATSHTNTRGGNSSRNNLAARRTSCSIRLLFHKNNQEDLESQKNLRREGRICWKEGDQDECPVCLEGLLADEMPVTLPCRHNFHRHCLSPWLLEHRKCPCCRENIAQVPDMESRTSPSDDDGDLMSLVAAVERDGERRHS